MSPIPSSSARADTGDAPAQIRGSQLLLLGVAAGFVLANAGGNALPLLLGSVIDGFGLDESGAGVLGSLELGGLAAMLLFSVGQGPSVRASPG